MSQSLEGQDPWTVPLVSPPPGISPNFNKQSPVTALCIGITVGVFVLMTATLSLRFWTKYKSTETWHLDDSFTILTFALAIVAATLQFYVVEYFGFEAWDIPLGLRATSRTDKIVRAAVCTILVMLFFGKCAILAFYLRMFAHLNTVRYQIYGAFAFAFIVIIASIFLPVWFEGVWKAGAVLSVGIIKLVLDLAIVFIPIPVVMGMHLSRAKKAGVLATFLIGSIAIVADIIDVYFRVKVYKGTSPFLNGVYVTLCGLVEAGISVIVASMPAAAKAWKRHIMTSSLYKMITAGPSRSILQTDHQLPSDFQKAKAEAQKKKRWGLYSIPSLFMSIRSEERSRESDRVVESAVTRSEMTMAREDRQSLEGKFSSLDESSLELRYPGNPDVGQNMV